MRRGIDWQWPQLCHSDVAMAKMGCSGPLWQIRSLWQQVRFWCISETRWGKQVMEIDLRLHHWTLQLSAVAMVMRYRHYWSIQNLQCFVPQPYGDLTWLTSCHSNYDAIMTIWGHFYSIIMTYWLHQSMTLTSMTFDSFLGQPRFSRQWCNAISLPLQLEIFREPSIEITPLIQTFLWKLPFMECCCVSCYHEGYVRLLFLGD